MKQVVGAIMVLALLGNAVSANADDRTRDVLPQLAQSTKIQQLMASALGTKAAGERELKCNFGDPTNYTLGQRVTWSRNSSECLRQVAEAKKLESQALAATSPAESVSVATQAAAIAALAQTIEESGDEATAQNDFLGLNWGVGIGASQLFDDAIEEAAVVDGVVRVTKESRTEPRVLFEFHRFFFTKEAGGQEPGTNGKSIRTGHGPFVAVAAKSDDVLAGIAAGWMWGWKDSRLPSSDDAFTVGIGVILDSDVKDLAKGFHEGDPLPEGETDVRYEEKSRAGIVLMFTRTF